MTLCLQSGVRALPHLTCPPLRSCVPWGLPWPGADGPAGGPRGAPCRVGVRNGHGRAYQKVRSSSRQPERQNPTKLGRATVFLQKSREVAVKHPRTLSLGPKSLPSCRGRGVSWGDVPDPGSGWGSTASLKRPLWLRGGKRRNAAGRGEAGQRCHLREPRGKTVLSPQEGEVLADSVVAVSHVAGCPLHTFHTQRCRSGGAHGSWGNERGREERREGRGPILGPHLPKASGLCLSVTRLCIT